MALIAVVYYAIGYFCKKLLAYISLRVTLAAIALSALLIAVDYRGWMNYVLNLKYVVYQHLLLDLLIPMVMTVALLGISQVLARSRLGRAVTMMGNVALPVAYLHVPINTVLLIEYHYHYGNVAAALIGFVTPVILSKLVFERFSLTRYLFQGRVPALKLFMRLPRYLWLVECLDCDQKAGIGFRGRGTIREIFKDALSGDPAGDYRWRCLGRFSQEPVDGRHRRPEAEYQQLVFLSGQQADEALWRQLKAAMKKYPGRSEQWYLEKIIYDLERDRR